MVFLTGDLGYKALEPLQEALSDRFINAGVAEQNMIGVAAGLARMGLKPWVYSIAPFVYARPFEQVRNDICLHDLPVTLIGNGGGYAYGVMGATHHALEDYGALSPLRNMHVFAPCFRSDLQSIIPKLAAFEHPAYLRLGLAEEPDGFEPPPYQVWRRVITGSGVTMLGVGPVAGSLLAALGALADPIRPNLWILTELPITELPEEFEDELRRSRCLLVVEEHVAEGSVGQQLAYQLLRSGLSLDRFVHVCALGYPSGLYGSQRFHRQECGLDPASVISQLMSMRSP